MKDKSEDERHWLPLPLTAEQRERWRLIRQFVAREVDPLIEEIEANEEIPEQLHRKLNEIGLWATTVPTEFGGRGYDDVSVGLVARALGSCPGLLSLYTVHAMTCIAVRKWGQPQQREVWLPRLARRECRAAFALSEPRAGSNPSDIETSFTRREGKFIANGVKTWISGGTFCDLALLFGLFDGKPTALLAPLTDTDVRRAPIDGFLGFRGAALGELRFENCALPDASVVGAPGFGLSLVANYALEVGRLCIAWGCVGLAEACLADAADFAGRRLIDGRPLSERDLVRRRLAGVFTQLTSARLLCYHASLARTNSGNSGLEACMAKYAASLLARTASETTTQILGASAYTRNSRAQRLWRDAKLMETIEGTTEVQELLLGQLAAQLLG